MMEPFEYIKNYYGVPACFKRRVKVNGKPGIICKDLGHYIGVNFDEDKPGHVLPCHPTWKVEYLGMGEIRKPTRSQQRYQRYLEYGDCFNDFLSFCYWHDDPDRQWNGGCN